MRDDQMESTTTIDNGMTISEIREEIRISEQVKREEINLIYRLEAQIKESRATVVKMDREINDYSSEIREIDRLDKKNKTGRYAKVKP